MFDVGFWEILLILVLALVVIGPERLPGAARQAGFFVGKARRYIEGVRSEVEEELDVGEFKRMLHNQEIQINELQQQIKTGVDDVTADLPKGSAADILTDTPSHSFYDEAPSDEVESSDAPGDASSETSNEVSATDTSTADASISEKNKS